LIYFKGLLENRPYLKQLAFMVLDETDEVKSGGIDEAFDEGVSKVDFKIAESMFLLSQLENQFDYMHSIALTESEYQAPQKYCTDRGHSLPRIIDDFDLVIDIDERRLVQPLRSLLNSSLLGMIGRSYAETKPKSKTYFGTKSSQSFSCSSKGEFDIAKRYLIVEGAQFDVYTCYYRLKRFGLLGELFPLGLNGSKITHEQASILALAYKPVWLMLDNDKAGKEGVGRAFDLLDGKLPSLRVVLLPDTMDSYNWDGPLDNFKGDPDSLKEEVFEAIIKKELAL
jgi:hypothetical protein